MPIGVFICLEWHEIETEGASLVDGNHSVSRTSSSIKVYLIHSSWSFGKNNVFTIVGAVTRGNVFS